MEWKRKFIELLEMNDMAEADNLKYAHFPRRFYKYQTLNKKTLNNFNKSEVYMRCASELNDPYECYHCIDLIENMRHHFRQPNFAVRYKNETGHSISAEDLEVIDNAENQMHAYVAFCHKNGINLDANADIIIKRKEKEICKFVDERRKNVSLSCFTTRSDSMLMWSHYGDQHRGICVEYHFPDQSAAKQLILPVYYSEKRYDITKRVIPPTNSKDISWGEFIGALHKAIDWQYEDEWRLISNKGINHFVVPKPSAIFLGVRFSLTPENTQRELAEFADNHQIPLVPMAIHPSNYTIVPDQSNIEYYLPS